LQAFEAGLSTAPDIDLKKVAEIKLAMSEGRFKVNSEAVADKLVASVQELLARQK
jgi:negative regulator of flagellin synthesis FlgM